MSSIKNKLAQSIASLFFKLKGVYQLDQEKAHCFWKSEFQGSLLKLVKNNQSNAFGKLHDFRRIKNPVDFQRLVPLDNQSLSETTTNKSTVENCPTRTRGITRVFELIAGWHSSPIFNSDWLIASNLYNHSISWAHLPAWLKLLSASPSEYFNPDWSGIFASAECLVSGSLDSLLKQRAESFSKRPAFILGEFASTEISSIKAATLKIPDNFIFLPIWRENSALIAILDPNNNHMRFLANNEFYPELLILDKNRIHKRVPFPNIEKGMEGEIILSASGHVWAKPTGVFVRIENANTFHFSFQEWQGKRPRPFSENTTIKTNQIPKQFVQPHPQKAGISAALSKIASHNPW
ncbi:MAG: hypothetical protein EBT92_00375 [Planctomycetes bacterium]|nr:hypothetical protein [Planctomycetota bacterium]NBY03004.1 hypothetical protein [Planctomycetota bacterium]